MLSPHEFGAGTLSEAKPLSLVLPVAKYDDAFIIGTYEEKPFAVFLTGQSIYCGIPCEGNKDFSGIIIQNVSIEVDEHSSIDTEYDRAADGALILENGELLIAFRQQRPMRQNKAKLLSELTKYSKSVAFTRWKIMIEDKNTKRMLYSIDATVRPDIKF